MVSANNAGQFRSRKTAGKHEARMIVVCKKVSVTGVLRRFFVTIVWIALSIWLSACQQVTITPKVAYPTPVTEPLPLTIGVFYDPSILDYSHSEEPPIGRSWTIHLGAGQQKLFAQTLSTIFTKTQPLTTLDNIAARKELAGILVPSLKSFEIATPKQTHTPYFEVWLQYEIRLLEPDGTLVTSQKIAAYGQKATGGLKRPSELMKAALNRALRDASANLITGFLKAPPVRSWLTKMSATTKP